MEFFLAELDRCLYNFLMEHASIMPKRFTKWLAYYFPDARVRKVYLQKLNVFLGDETYANIGFIGVNDAQTPIVIGDHVSIAPNCVCVACSAANNGRTINTIPYVKEHLTVSAPIHIEDEVWIGANVTILPGVTIGHGSIIGAGSVVTTDVDPLSIYAGVPARKIRDLKEVSYDQ